MVTIDLTAWQEGFNAARRGNSLDACPYENGSTEVWVWSSGFVEGLSKPLRIVTDHPLEGDDSASADLASL